MQNSNISVFLGPSQPGSPPVPKEHSLSLWTVSEEREAGQEAEIIFQTALMKPG